MTTTLLTDAASELQPATFSAIDTCLVLAPHPDDESLGCGGLIALLREEKKDVFVVFTTDGSASHPASKQYPAEALAALRKREAIAALQVLNVPDNHIFFFNKKDGALPAEGDQHFAQNANQLLLLINILQPDLVLVPYEKDPHRDHRATWQMLAKAHRDENASYRILEYMVWLLERGDEVDMPDKNTMRYVDISNYRRQKQSAISRHLSQTTDLIKDDPHGFTLSKDMLARFNTNKEYYIDRNL